MILDPSKAGRITILNDSFGNSSSLRQDWGFAALIEFGTLRILFDKNVPVGVRGFLPKHQVQTFVENAVARSTGKRGAFEEGGRSWVRRVGHV